MIIPHISVVLSKIWVMKSRYRYGIWDFIELWDFPVNRIGGHQKPWGITGYGFPWRRVKVESTV